MKEHKEGCCEACKGSEYWNLEGICLHSCHQEEKVGSWKSVEQKHYELAMQIQAIDFFLSKDEEEYGSTALHGKLRAFLSSLLTDKEEGDNLKSND